MLLLCLGFTAYFAYHAIYGRHGLEVRSALTERSALLEFEINSLEAVRANVEKRSPRFASALNDGASDGRSIASARCAIVKGK